MRKGEYKPDLEMRRFESIYRTFVKMKDEERERTLNFMVSRFISDKKKNKLTNKK